MYQNSVCVEMSISFWNSWRLHGFSKFWCLRYLKRPDITAIHKATTLHFEYLIKPGAIIFKMFLSLKWARSLREVFLWWVLGVVIFLIKVHDYLRGQNLIAIILKWHQVYHQVSNASLPGWEAWSFTIYPPPNPLTILSSGQHFVGTPKWPPG